MEYYRFSGGAGRYFYVRTSPEAYSAEEFDVEKREWVRRDVYFTEIYSNGGGQEVSEVEALDAVGHLQSA